ncbi:MAG: 4Fe-4S dicluster domain-containing protein [Fibrobacterota bacterium]
MSASKTVVDVPAVQARLKKRAGRNKLALTLCAHCSMCADSCFLYRSKGKDPEYMPSHKVINTVGRLYKKKGRVTIQDLEEMREIAFKRCVLCMRCYCPLGLNIPEMIGFARSVCRSQGVYPDYEK